MMLKDRGEKILSVYKRIETAGIEIPRIERKGQGMLSIRQDKNLLYLSGQGPLDLTGEALWQGSVGKDLSIAEGYKAARYTGSVAVGCLEEYLGDLRHVDTFIKCLGFISSAPDFYEQPKVMHGFSDLIVEIFGERGQHARSAIGTSVLPYNIPIEVEAIVRIR